MKVWEVQKRTGFDALSLSERTEPVVKAGEVLVKMHAFSLNYRDLLVVKEAHEDTDQPPVIIPVSDGAGEVVAIGEGVLSLKKGDRVASCFMPDWIEGELTPQNQKTALGYMVDGVLSEYVVFPEQGVVTVPDHLSYTEAATLPCAALTAWNALTRGRLSPGETVLIQGTGGVSIFALQFALLFGARVIVISSSETKLERLQDLGAALTINYKTKPDWETQVKEFTHGSGVNHIVEVGGADTLCKSLSAIKYGGRISIIGHVSGDTIAVNLRSILSKNIILQGIYVGSREMFKAMNSAISLHKLKPITDKVFEFGQVHEAMEYMEKGAHFGKICITI